MSKTRTPKTAKPKDSAIPRPKTRTDKAPAKPPVAPDPNPVAEPVQPKPMSGLDAAALILREAGEPLDAQALTIRILERGLWKTEGKTPAATIYAAMIREIKAKGSSSRFQKVDRGRFAAAG